MDRREFFKRTGLGTGALFLAPMLVAAAWQEEWQAEEVVAFAVQLAIENGATYADARIGNCSIQGKEKEFEALQLLKSNMLGMRICTENAWRHLVIRDLSRDGIRENLALAFSDQAKVHREPGVWISAHFDQSEVLAAHSSDPQIAPAINSAMLRYAARPKLLPDARHLLFCDLLLEQ